MDPGRAISEQTGIMVVGAGDGGCAALDRLVSEGALDRLRHPDVQDAECLAVNTDAQALSRSLIAHKVPIGGALTNGHGAGGDPTLGRRAAEEARESLRAALHGAGLVVIAAGMGGGTGSGAAPVIAQIARDLGALVIGVITVPFNFEGNRRRRVAEQGASDLVTAVDTLITVPCDRLHAALDVWATLPHDRLQIMSHNPMTRPMAFWLAEEALCTAIRGICDPLAVPGPINFGIADLASVFSAPGHAVLGLGCASGESRAAEAARGALQSPLLDGPIDGARTVLLTVAGSGFTLFEVHEAAAIIQEAAGLDAIVTFSAVNDQAVENALRVTLIATGLEARPERRQGWGISGEPPGPGGPPPSDQRVPRRPHPSAGGGAAEAVPPAAEVVGADAVGSGSAVWLPDARDNVIKDVL